ncbi:MAG: preprotein translocase subunit YajC [Deltaproteobacteria bacterium]|nr:preprotein translocase subunit YajC [Deltaproteobacteria bacterium]
MFAPMALVFVVFYFLLIRPQQKQQKKLLAQVNAMRKGDQVVTRSGIHGKVAQLQDGTILLEIANNVQIKLNKDQVAAVVSATEKTGS